MAAEPQSTEGQIPFQVPGVEAECKTWYKVFGPPITPDTIPLICLHGGPGYPHHYLLPIRHLASTLTRPILFYDQLGCGNSTRLRSQPSPKTFWTPELFLSELANLIQHLGITSYDLLGQSWGGMLASCHAVLRPAGLRRLIIADSPASMQLWVEAADRLLAVLPEEVRETLKRCEREGTTDTQEYQDAIAVFYDKHVCRVKPTPEEVKICDKLLKEDHTVYGTMNGPSEFTISGTLRSWSVIPSLHKINVPTLLINGKYDEAQDSVMQPFFDKIEKVKWVRFAESSHLPQLEEPEEFLSVVAQFIST